MERGRGTHPDDARGLLGGVEDDKPDVDDHLALVVLVLSGAAEHADQDLGRCCKSARVFPPTGRGKGGRTVELDDGGVGELAAVPDGSDVAPLELVGDRDAVDLV